MFMTAWVCYRSDDGDEQPPQPKQSAQSDEGMVANPGKECFWVGFHINIYIYISYI